jgi:hypothetical protein
VLRSGAVSASAGDSISIDGVAQLPGIAIFSDRPRVSSDRGAHLALPHSHIVTVHEDSFDRICRTVTLQTRDEHGLTPGAVTHYSGSAAAVLCQSLAYSICFDDGQCIQHIKVHQACDAAELGIATGLL